MHRNLLKISKLSLVTLVGISEFWEAFFLFEFKMSFSISASLTSTKLKLEAYLYLLSTRIVLGRFLYFRIAYRVGSLIFRIKGSESGNLELLRFWTTFEKKVFIASSPYLSLRFLYFLISLFFPYVLVYRIVKVWRSSRNANYLLRFSHLN